MLSESFEAWLCLAKPVANLEAICWPLAAANSMSSHASRFFSLSHATRIEKFTESFSVVITQLAKNRRGASARSIAAGTDSQCGMSCARAKVSAARKAKKGSRNCLRGEVTERMLVVSAMFMSPATSLQHNHLRTVHMCGHLNSHPWEKHSMWGYPVL